MTTTLLDRMAEATQFAIQKVNFLRNVLSSAMIANAHAAGRALYEHEYRVIENCRADKLRALLAEYDALKAREPASEADKDIAIAQAVEFAEYVSEHAKGKMVDAAQKFLSLPYSQEVEERLKMADAYKQAIAEWCDGAAGFPPICVGEALVGWIERRAKEISEGNAKP